MARPGLDTIVNSGCRIEPYQLYDIAIESLVRSFVHHRRLKYSLSLVASAMRMPPYPALLADRIG
jgi:hypothetical protein